MPDVQPHPDDTPYLDHGHWHALHGESAHPDSTLWFHGTTRAFTDFRVREPASPGSTVHWNNHLGGPHFAHGPATAALFAEGYYQRGAEQRRLGTGIPDGGRLIPVRLGVLNPHHFGREEDMDDLAAAVAIRAELIKAETVKFVSADLESDDPDQWDRLPAHLRGNDCTEDWTDWLAGHASAQDLASDPAFQGLGVLFIRAQANHDAFAMYYEDERYGEGDPEYTESLATVGQTLSQYLQARGHDGVTYVNTVEGGVSAVPFRLDQIRSAYEHDSQADQKELHPCPTSRSSTKPTLSAANCR